MTSKPLRDILQRAESWSTEDQEELASYAREIEARRTGIYPMTDAEAAAVEKGLEQLEKGEFVSADDMTEVWKRLGVT